MFLGSDKLTCHEAEMKRDRLPIQFIRCSKRRCAMPMGRVWRGICSAFRNYGPVSTRLPWKIPMRGFEPLSAEDIRTPSAGNRPICIPIPS